MKQKIRFLPLASAALCVITLALLLADIIWPHADLFLNGGVKLVLLATCILASACAMQIIARQRRRERELRRRWMKQR